MGNIRLKLTAITPIHIGSGEIYEPTNFVIDGGVLYEFRDEDFFMELSSPQREALLNIVKESKSDSFVKIHNFVKKNLTIAKRIAHSMVVVTEGFEKEYNKVVGNLSQLEEKGRALDRVFNRFEIQRIQRKQVKTLDCSYAHTGYIVGSSLKGAISTAYQEFIYKKEGKKALKRKFQAKGREISNNLFKEFKVSDSFVERVGTKIGFALNKERFEYDRYNQQNNIKLSTQIEVIEKDSQFFVDINYGTLEIKEILKSCNDHYMPIFKSIMQDSIKNYVDTEFMDNYHRYLQLKPNQYLIRVGKHSGARAVTIEGLRDIKSKVSGGGKRRKPNIFEQRKDETTTWLFGDNPKSNSNLIPFGWLLCEVSDEEPSKFEAIDSLLSKRVEERRLSELERAKREKAKQEEEQRAKEEQAKREAKLASMTPLEKKIDELVQNDKNTPKSTLIFNAIKNKQFENERLEALEFLKSLLIKDKKWKEKSTAKNPKKDKMYKRTLEIIEMLNMH